MDLRTFLLLLVTSFFSYISQVLISWALSLEKAGRVSALNYLQVVIAFIADLVFFDTEIRWTDFLGAFLIIFFTFFNSFRKCFV